MSLRTNALVCGIMCGVVGIAAYSAGHSRGEEKKAAPRLYELRIYTTHPGRLPALHKRFHEHTMKLFEKHGMDNMMYWVPTDEKLKDNTLIYILSHAGQEAADKSWKAFLNDPEWLKVKEDSERDGPIVAKVDKRYMVLTEYSPPAK
jgi:hypothetical protein